MNSIKIITIHCIPNFGSVFQSYGLLQFLKSKGYSAELINYVPSYYAKGRNRLRMIMPRVLFPISFIKQKRAFGRFIKNELGISGEKIKDASGLNRYSDEYGIYISGGDQLWNTHHPCGNDDAYKLVFVKQGIKIAYGTSIGRNNLTDNEVKLLAQKTNDYKSIGLREQSTVPMLASRSKTEVYHAADPVLLLKKEDYLPFVSKGRLINEPYVLVYLAAKSNVLSKTVEYVAQSRGLKVVHCIGFTKKIKCDYFMKSTGPDDLLNLIYHADFVISASFHATLFSTLFEKQFCSLLPGENVNARIEDWLGYVGLKDRIVHDIEDIKRTDKQIDFSSVTPIVDGLAERSREKLVAEIEKYKR